MSAAPGRDEGPATPVLSFHGAAGGVTGSRFLVECGTHRVLVDCGLFQGPRDWRRRNWEDFPVDPATIDAVVLTHAHLDHCGYLPALAKQGFAGPVFATEDTAELVPVVLRDSAHLQEEDAAYAREKGFSKHRPPMALYDTADAEVAVRLLRGVPYGRPVPPAPGFTVTFHPAGHILGSATVELGVGGRTVLFSGDLGRRNHPLFAPPAPPVPCDVLVVESTYGDRRHPPPNPDRLASAIRRTVARGGDVVIPAFAIDRTAVVLLELRRLRRTGQIPDVPVLVDSPMAMSALEIYRRALIEGGAGMRETIGGDDNPFDPGRLSLLHTVEESRAANEPSVPSVIVSASGMASGGRVVHHLAAALPDPRNTVVLVGFQAVGTRGRDLLDGARQLKMLGRYVPVRAEVVEVTDFSVHADADELMAWLHSEPATPDACYIVHGEPDSARALADRVRSELHWLAVVARDGERVRID